jgi:colanic acid/amylovoran biosynthesis glycosyltransferase
MSTEPRIAYVCSRYPDVSHTFIQREIVALRERGVEVATYSVRRAEPHQVLSRLDREEFERTYAILPPRRRDHVRAHLRALRKGPGAWLRTLWGSLRRTPGGPRATLWRLFYFAEAVVLWDRCERQGIRHLHAHFANVGSDVAQLAARLGRGLGEPWSWSFTMHGSTEFYDVRRWRLADKVRDARFVACISDYTRSQLMMLVDASHWEKLRLVRCGVDTAHFRPSARRDEAGPVRILYVGRLVRNKGAGVLLEALAGLDAELVLVGDGPDRGEMEALARGLGVAGRVRFTGAVGQDEILARFQEADVFCLPSFAEGLPVVLMEAMASGLPVVASSITAAPELVEDGVSGLLVSPARPDLLRDALARLVADPGLRRSLGEAGRRKVEADFELSSGARALHAVLRDTLHGPQRRPEPPAPRAAPRSLVTT